MLSLGFTTTHFRTTLPSIPQNKPFSSLATCPLPTKTNNSIFYPCIFSPTKSAKVNSISASSNIDNVVAKEYVEEEKQELLLPAGLRPELMPKHVAVFMDGHRRWARGRGLPVEDGHRAGGEKIKEIARLCSNFGIKVLSVFAFSAGSWTRPKEELDFLMKMFEQPSMADMQEGLKMNIRGSIIGDTSVLSNSLQRMISLGVDATKANTGGLHVIAALNYSGRYDITQACKSIANKVKDGLLEPQDINGSIFEQELETKCTEFPSPDLFIRTSGEHRISNFMLWQMAYSELYFVDKLFPDFEEGDFVEALKSFQKRDRRYGGQKHSESL